MTSLNQQELNDSSESKTTIPCPDDMKYITQTTLNVFYLRNYLNVADEEMDWELRHLKNDAETKEKIIFIWWQHKIAQDPQKQENGEWVDIKSGISFKEWFSLVYPEMKKPEPESKSRFSLTEEEKEARNVAKKLGGKALKGSEKQKKWGEKIRARFLKKLDKSMAEYFAKKEDFCRAEFWIDNRFLFVDELVRKYKKN